LVYDLGIDELEDLANPMELSPLPLPRVPSPVPSMEISDMMAAVVKIHIDRQITLAPSDPSRA
jgi:hypothetical protein